MNDSRYATDAAPSASRSGAAWDLCWDRLREAESLEEIAEAWLDLSMRNCAAESGAVFLCDENGALSALAQRGEDDLAIVASRAVEHAAPISLKPEDSPRKADLAHPIMRDGAAACIAAMRIDDASPMRLRSVARGLLWGSAWLSERLGGDAAREGQIARDAMWAAHRIVADALDAATAHEAALGAVGGLARLAGADRVCLGERRGRRSRVRAISHSAGFGRNMALNRAAAAAMDEAIDQRAAISHPAPPDDLNANPAQRALSGLRADCAILTLPFRVNDSFRGAVTFERAQDQPFTPDQTGLLDFAVSLVGPVLFERKSNESWLPVKAWETLKRQFARLFGPGYAARKMTLIAALCLGALFWFWRAPYTVTATAQVEGELVRALVAPFDGFIERAPLRAGDRVEAGQPIAALDDRALRLERLRQKTVERQRQLEYERAIGENDRAGAQISRALIEQAQAQVALIDADLARAELTAPFSGLILTGDLTQLIGAAVERGQTLFEVAEGGAFQLALGVDESRVSEVAPGAEGVLVLAALPETRIKLTVERFTPVSYVENGANHFRFEAHMPDMPPQVAPGMRGVAKITVGERRQIEIWTREFVAWSRLKWWELFG